MLSFSGCLQSKEFVRASSARIALFLVSIIGFPSIPLFIAQAIGCGIGICSRVLYLAAVWYQPSALGLFVFSFIGISMRRARDAGLPAWVGLFVPLLFWADHGFFDFVWVPWLPNIAPMALKAMSPLFALLGFVCLAALAVLPSRGGNPNPLTQFGPVGLLALGLLLVVAVYAMLEIAGAFHGAVPLARPLALLLSPGLIFVPYVMVGLVPLLAWIVSRQRRRTA